MTTIAQIKKLIKDELKKQGMVNACRRTTYSSYRDYKPIRDDNNKTIPAFRLIDHSPIDMTSAKYDNANGFKDKLRRSLRSIEGYGGETGAMMWWTIGKNTLCLYLNEERYRTYAPSVGYPDYYTTWLTVKFEQRKS